MSTPRPVRLTLPLLLLAAACGDGPADRPAASRASATDASVTATTAAVPRRGSLRVDPNLGYSQGREDAPVTVHEFSDYGCAYCATFQVTTFQEIRRDYIETGQVRWIFVPFVVGMFRHGEEAARAGECAAEQDAFWPMKERLYGGQRDWRRGRAPLQHFGSYAAALGLDTARFESCYEENRGGARTLLNNRTAQILGVRGTPTFIINGRLVEGTLPIERFRALFEASAAAEAAAESTP